MGEVTIKIKRAAHADGLPLPEYATPGSAGMDLCAAVEGERVLRPGESAAVPTGLHIALPEGYELQVRARSGLAARHGIGVLNGPGTVDSDYRGEVKVLLVNHGAGDWTYRRGDRIAQAVLAPVTRARWQESEELEASERGEGGFGHTGQSAANSEEGKEDAEKAKR